MLMDINGGMPEWVVESLSKSYLSDDCPEEMKDRIYLLNKTIVEALNKAGFLGWFMELVVPFPGVPPETKIYRYLLCNHPQAARFAGEDAYRFLKDIEEGNI